MELGGGDTALRHFDLGVALHSCGVTGTLTLTLTLTLALILTLTLTPAPAPALALALALVPTLPPKPGGARARTIRAAWPRATPRAPDRVITSEHDTAAPWPRAHQPRLVCQAGSRLAGT